MGSCFSKKNVCASSPPPAALPDPPEKLKSETLPEKKEETAVVKKEIFIIKHRKSHEVERQRSEAEKAEIKEVEEFVDKGKIVSSSNGLEGGGAPVRTSSCTKEEVDAILIQCGRLSRSSSTGKAAVSSENGGRKYSGSKRSYDFDSENGKCDDNNGDGDDEAVARERDNRRRERHRQSQGRRRTPSRERERDQAAQQRSGSRERGGSGGGRRVSRSPGRRSESPITTNSGANSSSSAANGNSRPGKMVSVPATVPSTNAEPNMGSVKRIQVKRNVGGETRSGASPRARSPARLRASNDNQQQPMSLSRSNSRKAEHSPFRRNPLADIDTNIISQATPIQKVNADNKTALNSSSNLTNGNCKNQEQQQLLVGAHVGFNVISPVTENPKASAVTRSRSSRLSRDLDINPETLSNPNNNTSSYTALLLEDIQNFHQKSTTPPPPTAFSLPPCVTKACSILEAVADLNSSTGSNLSTTDLLRNASEQMNKTAAANPIRKAKQEIKDPIMESEIVASDDLMQPSFHKYVTVRRGGVDDDLEEQESSGSNSFAGSQQQWASSSCWEPNSAESTDRWMSSSTRSVSRQNDVSPVGYQRHTPSDEGGGKKHSAAKKREADHQHQHQQSGNGRGGRIANRVSHLASAAVAST
ncbi:hypothetical protein C2S53_017062 [Perilla frutescens var. hirtella]|uniref:Uncharacterized protein n=1 Tax=Perilla frutescens var. hirtella TaxID=608512 RepID=A0AAD4PFU0_PERFH|nr:hypothetical protein C2S53_017062 [Perilla frutescens var. hirtella]